MSQPSTLEQSIARTRRGVVPFATIMGPMRYVGQAQHPQGGTYLLKDSQREAFISTGLQRWPLPNARSWTTVRGKPVALVGEPVDRKMLLWCPGEPVGSFELIPWTHVGLCLVIRRAPPSYIGDEWLAFCPLQEVAEALAAVNPHAPAASI